MAFKVVRAGIGKGSLFGYGRFLGVHLPFALAQSKAQDPFMNWHTLVRLTNHRSPSVRESAASNLAGQLLTEEGTRVFIELVGYEREFSVSVFEACGHRMTVPLLNRFVELETNGMLRRGYLSNDLSRRIAAMSYEQLEKLLPQDEAIELAVKMVRPYAEAEPGERTLQEDTHEYEIGSPGMGYRTMRDGVEVTIRSWYVPEEIAQRVIWNSRYRTAILTEIQKSNMRLAEALRRGSWFYEEELSRKPFSEVIQRDDY